MAVQWPYTWPIAYKVDDTKGHIWDLRLAKIREWNEKTGDEITQESGVEWTGIRSMIRS